jgi:ribonuclease Z
VAHRTVEAGLDLTEVEAVFLTHHHSDHVSDLANLAIARFVAGPSGPLRVVAPDGPSRRFAASCLDPFEDTAFYSQRDAGTSIRPELDVLPFAATEELTVVHRDRPVTVEATLVDHGPMEAAVGYRVSIGSTVVAISGDTVAGAGVRRLADRADLLIHQALRSDRVPEASLVWNANAKSVGALAHDAQVAHLVLTHLMPTPADVDDEQAFVTEAESGGYRGPIAVAHDLDVVEVP